MESNTCDGCINYAAKGIRKIGAQFCPQVIFQRFAVDSLHRCSEQSNLLSSRVF
jgi:hypothetical protein